MYRNIYPTLWILLLFLSACGKKELPQKADPLKFGIEHIKELNTGIYPVSYELHFINESDSGEYISYRWRFGDGATADGYNTTHAYPKPGSYTVWLIKYNKNNAIDSGSISIKVDAIPLIIKRSASYSSFPIGIGAYQNKVYLAGYQSYDNSQIGYREGFLTKYDSLWREQWTKIYPIETGKIENMSITANGDVLLTVIKEQGKARLYRIDGNGDVKWTWTSTVDNMWVYSATEDKQGNIVMMVTKPNFNTGSFSNITIQLDAAGKENWTYDWINNELWACEQLVTLPDGYIMAGFGGCTGGCLHIAKLTLDGKNIWNNTVALGKKTSFGIRQGVCTVLDHSNQLQVACGSYYTYHTFDLNGQHLGSREFGIDMAVTDLQINKNGSMLALGNQLYYGANARLLEYKPNGGAGWLYSPINSIIDFNLAQSPTETISTSMGLTDNNEALITGRFSWIRPGYGSFQHLHAIFVCRINSNGKLN